MSKEKSETWKDKISSYLKFIQGYTQKSETKNESKKDSKEKKDKYDEEIKKKEVKHPKPISGIVGFNTGGRFRLG